MTDQLPPLPEETTLLEDPSDLPTPLLLLPPETPADSTTTTTTMSPATRISHVTQLPPELQVNVLTYLRAYDLASVHQTCRFYHDPVLVHAIVIHAAERVYPAELTQGFEQQPVMASISAGSTPATTATAANGNKKGKKKAVAMTKKGANDVASTTSSATTTTENTHYTFEHLRNMELLIVARVLSRPEPASPDDGALAATGGCYYVSKSWCKTALKWLEWQQERQEQYAAQQAAAAAAAAAHGHSKKKANHATTKLSKKQQRLRQRKYSDASPPWPNVNSDIVCCHNELQLCSNRKSARARRKILDKQAWKCLKKLYPESIPLEAQRGECLQCIFEAETVKKTQQQREEQLKEERKAPLSQPVLRRFYTRTRGVPVHCLKHNTGNGTRTTASVLGGSGQDDAEEEEEEEDCKMPAKFMIDCCDNKDNDVNRPSSLIMSSMTPTKKTFGGCPLVPGLYYAVPRAWCHAWRKYMKTGEGGPLLPPDGSALLCDAHRLSLLPPHLESYLYGESPQLWLSKKQQQEEEGQQHSLDESSSSVPLMLSSPVARRSVVVGLTPTTTEGTSSPAVDFAFLTPLELAQQQRAMITLERQREKQQREREASQQLQQQQLQQDQEVTNSGRCSSFTAGEQLDRENYCCVEILAHDELEELEKLWPRSGTSTFRLSFKVLPGQDVSFTTLPCRECDASGKANFCKIPKNSKAHLRAAHQARVRIYKEQKSSANNNSGGNGNAKPGVQLEY